MAIVENGCSSSTTFVWKKVKITAPPRPKEPRRAKRVTQTPPPQARNGLVPDLRAPKTVQVRARGGAELWWEITWGGVTRRFPGHVVLQDVLVCVFTHEAGCRGHREERYGD